MGRDLAAVSALRMEEERQKERLQSILSRIRLQNDKAIADVQNRMSFLQRGNRNPEESKSGYGSLSKKRVSFTGRQL
jgi:hypothetical protein